MQKQLSKSLKHRRSAISFLILIIPAYFFFDAYHTIDKIFIQQESIDLATDNLQTIANQAHAFDQDLATFIRKLDVVIKAYYRGENIFIEQPDTIDEIRGYIANNSNRLKTLGFEQYHKLFQLLTDLYPHQKEIYSFLGQDDTKNYLALLQNASEKRPNGGFFGSFAFASIRYGFIEQLGVVDSYLPDYLSPTTRIQAPDRSHSILEAPEIRFIASNKFGFTNIDGKNIKTLYETIFNKTYDQQKFQQSDYSDLEQTLVHKDIDGILFLNTDMFEKTTPALTPLLQKRQFINANIDIIRGEDRSHKKEIYLNEVNQYFTDNSKTLTMNIIKKFDDITSHNLLNIYLPNASPALQDIFKKYNLTTHYDSNKIYVRDTNHAFNKIDRFIDKEIVISQDNQVLYNEFNKDILQEIPQKAGEYRIDIYYNLNVPQQYKETMFQYAAQYNVTMTERELGILGLGPTYDELYRANQITLHLPTTRIINKTSGDIVSKQLLSSPFSQVINMRSEMTTSSTANHIQIEFSIP